MKLALILLVVALVAVTLVADYTWRKWMADRKRERQE